MAIAWDGAGGLFTDIGKVIAVADAWEGADEGALEDHLNEIIVAFDDGTMTHIEGLRAAFNAFRTNMVGFRKSISKTIESRILDVVKIINELKIAETKDLSIVLPRLREQMAADGKTLNKNTTTLGAVAAAAGNTGNGTLITTKVLDGWNRPGDFFPADKNYAGIDSELTALSETLTVECVADSQNDAKFEAGESWKAYGNPANPPDNTPTPYFGHGVEGSGSSKDGFIVGPQSATLLKVPGFDEWTTDPTPALTGGWTIEGAGVLGTNISKETTIVYRGAAALKLTQTAAIDPIGVSQAMPVSRLRPLRRYLVSVRYRADAAVAAGTFGVEFNGTGYAPGADKISVAAGAIPTAWTLATFQLNMPAVIPDDFKLIIKATGPLTNGRSIYVDDVYVQPMYYYGGVGMAVVPGSVRSVRGDRYSFTVANDRAGVIQSFLTRYLGRQFPSGSPGNISDDLAVSSITISIGPPGP